MEVILFFKIFLRFQCIYNSLRAIIITEVIKNEYKRTSLY